MRVWISVNAVWRPIRSSPRNNLCRGTLLNRVILGRHWRPFFLGQVRISRRRVYYACVSRLPIIHSSRQVARSRLFRIEELDITFSNGVEVQYERLVPDGHGAVIVVPFQDPETVLLIREYSAGTERYELALPKGRMEAGERPEEAANREMAEEIGFSAERLTRLTDLSLAPGYMRHATHLVLAQGLSPAQAEGDEPEPLEVVPWRLDRLLELGLREDCTEARSLAALYLARDYLRGTD